MSKRKADCTSEEWQERLRKQRLYMSLPHMKERVKIYREKQFTREKRDKYNATQRIRNRLPEVKKQIAERLRIKERCFTPGLYADLLVFQQNKCAVCSRPFDLSDKNLKPHADHCHVLNRPRGLLCRHCNSAEGMIKKTGLSLKEFYNKLYGYLQYPPASYVSSLTKAKKP